MTYKNKIFASVNQYVIDKLSLFFNEASFDTLEFANLMSHTIR